MLTSMEKNDRTWAPLIHLSGLLGYVLPVPGMSLIGPLVAWLATRNESPFLDDQGKEALNFNLSYLFYIILLTIFWLVVAVALFGAFAGQRGGEAFPFLVILLGIISGGLLFLWHVVFTIVAAIQSSNGTAYRYPMIFRLIR